MSLRISRCLCVLAALAATAPTPATADPQAASVEAAVVTETVAPKAAEVMAVPVAKPKPAVTLQAKIDLTRQSMTVMEGSRTLATWSISSGVEDHATPRGVFQPQWTAKMWFSRTYDNAPMPHAVFFKDGAAVHATQAVGALGRAASHGCVRLAPANAETFYKLVQKHGLAHTRIAVSGTPNYSRPVQVAHRTSARPLVRVAAVQVQTGNEPGILSGLFGNPAPKVTYVSSGPDARQRSYYRPITRY